MSKDVGIIECASKLVNGYHLEAEFISQIDTFKETFAGDPLLPCLGEQLYKTGNPNIQKYVLSYLREFAEADMLHVARFAKFLATNGQLPVLEAHMDDFFRASLSAQEFTRIRKEALEQQPA